MDNGKIKVGFGLLGIRTEQFALFEENYDAKIDSTIEVGFEFRLDQASRQIGVFSSFEYMQSEKHIIKLKISCHYKIADETWDQLLKVEESKLRVPKGFLAHLAMLTIGTARGVLFAKTEGTVFSKMIIPILNVAEMITQDLDFEVNQTTS
jgi:hypothetical protein